jgi:serine/threonine-protein kinase
MGPLALFIIWLNSGRPPLPQGIRMAHIVLMSAANFICAGMAYVGARIIYRLGTEVARERELGSYQLDSRIGQGGMGEVWQARHRMLIRPAAIKLIRPDRLGVAGEDADKVVKRFEREAQATAALKSPHTVELYDFGVTEDGTLYYVMEMLDGLNMETLVNRFGPLPSDRTSYLLMQVCESLREAHRRDLIHRDIKPANIFVCRFGLEHDYVKVLDFGLVRWDAAGGKEETRLTREGLVGGTPAFLPPEMALGKSEIDGRTDIYALGCVAYWLVTGELVFEGETPMELAMKHVQESPTSPSQRSELHISEALEDIILQCLRKDPAERPQSASALSQLLQESRSDRGWDPSAAAEWWSKHLPETANSQDLLGSGSQ